MTTPRPETLAKLTPVLTKRWLSPDAWRIGTYEKLDGYAALRKALKAHPDDLIQLIKDSGCAGAAARASRPASSGGSSRRATASRTTWW